MHVVTFVLPDETADVLIGVVYSFTSIKPHRSHRPTDSHSIPYLHREPSRKNIGFGTRTTQPAAILRITGQAAIRL